MTKPSSISGRADLRQEYAREAVASDYVASRFERDHFGRALHNQQVSILRQILGQVRPHQILEVAPGPARLSVYVRDVDRACAVEQSAAMIQIARQRLSKETVAWRLIQGDAFNLPIRNDFADALMTFRFYRHFDASERRILLGELRRVLKGRGSLILDVPNQPMYEWLLERMGMTAPRVADYWFTPEQFREEMAAAGFAVERMYPVQADVRLQHRIWGHLGERSELAARLLAGVVSSMTKHNPLEWVSVCRRA